MRQSGSDKLDIGEVVYDKYQRDHPGEELKELIVLDVHPDTRADEFGLESGEVLADVVDKWPFKMPDSYDPDGDTVVEVVFHESLDWNFGGAWVEWSSDKVKRICEVNDVAVYAYHRERLLQDLY